MTGKLTWLSEEALQAGRRPVLIHGYHPPEYSSKDVFPLEDMLSGEVRYETWWVKELRPELPSKQEPHLLRLSTNTVDLAK
ncbi:hypothetical protein EJB05_39390, partial [Eragrostis curvula]